jgi:hypothetical protein
MPQKSMSCKEPIYPDRIRKIRGSFSWIEHRFVHGSFLRELSRDELLLYYFLVTVGDKNGVSFYGYEKICHLLKMDVDAYLLARNRLIRRQMIAQRKGVSQVLPLPERCPPLPSEKKSLDDTGCCPELPKPSCRGTDSIGRHQPLSMQQSESGFRSLAEIFKKLGEAP